MKNIKYKINIHGVLLFILFFLVLPIDSSAKRVVTIATIGNRPPALDKTQGYQRMVNQMKNFWRRELNQVLPDQPDLIVLQENTDLPWGLNQEEKNSYIVVRENQMHDFFASTAKENSCYILYCTRRYDEKGVLRNSGILIDRKGEIKGIYDKNYPTIGEMEGGIIPSNEVPVFECDFGRLAVAICYDLNFDAHRERYFALEPDIIAFPSAYHGGFIQSLWAYSCRSFFVGAIGSLGRNSEILNPLGEIVAESTNYFNYAVTEVNLDYKLVHLDYNRPKLRSLKSKYGKGVKITDPGGLGVVMITSEDSEVEIEQMMNEFEIEILDDYFGRSMEYRNSKLIKN